MTVSFKSVAQLSCDLRDNLHKLPKDVTLVVGVPRSGMLVASLLALYLNVPLADFDGFLQGRILKSGKTRTNAHLHASTESSGTILIVDDSSSSGAAMKEVKAALGRNRDSFGKIVTVVAYGASNQMDNIDIILEVVPLPRVFEWNLFHHPILEHACVDIDGVLCHDPSTTENDDGENYLRFLRAAKPLVRPTYKIGTLVTSRLEKYRGDTEAWLESQRIVYGKLIMLDLPDAETRRRHGAHGSFKAAAYSTSDAIIFIESEYEQAEAIARVSGKPVISIEGMIEIGSAHMSAKALAWRFKRRVADHQLIRKVLGTRGRKIAKAIANKL